LKHKPQLQGRSQDSITRGAYITFNKISVHVLYPNIVKDYKFENEMIKEDFSKHKLKRFFQ